MILRLSHKLAKKLHENALAKVPDWNNPYLDWYAHLFYFNRLQYFIVINCTYLFTVVFLGKGVTSIAEFTKRFTTHLADQCDALHAGHIYQQNIAPFIDPVQTAKPVNRRVIGCMNEQISFAKFVLSEDFLSPVDLAKELNENILSPIRYLKPRMAFLGEVRERKCAQ